MKNTITNRISYKESQHVKHVYNSQRRRPAVKPDNATTMIKK